VNYWPYVVVLVLLAGLVAFSVRGRRRQVAEQAARADRIEVGTEVMTTSGLYATVVGKYDDGTVRLSIAPGVEVKWATAALRDAPSLADPYRRPLQEGAPDVDAADEPGSAHRPGADGTPS
jgi:preprotein translocase subunit YajC